MSHLREKNQICQKKKKKIPGQGSGYTFSKVDLAFGSLNYSKFGYWTLIKLLFFVLK